MKDSLLQSEETGSTWHSDFVNECTVDDRRFERANKRRKVKNFTHDAVKVKVTTKDNQVKEAKCTRDIFGRLLYLSVTQGLDLCVVLSYPLTPVLFSLCHITGDMNMTSKSTLMDKLEATGTLNAIPDWTEVYIIDTMFSEQSTCHPPTGAWQCPSLNKLAALVKWYT